MIIDFHTHTYPNSIAHGVIDKLAKQVNIFNYTDGTMDALSVSQLSAGIDYSVLLPVATKPSQTVTINRNAAEINYAKKELHLLSFAAIHPDNEDYEDILRSIKIAGFPGIKLHPMFQQTPLNDDRYLRIIDEAVSLGLLVLIHGGADINFLGCDYAAPFRTRDMLEALGHPSGIIIAHMGGILYWEEVIEQLSGFGLYLDTSSCIGKFLSYEGKEISGTFRKPLSHTLFRDIVDAFGADHILFGSDSPWQGQRESLRDLYSTGLDREELRLIQGDNAAKLLKLMPSHQV